MCPRAVDAATEATAHARAVAVADTTAVNAIPCELLHQRDTSAGDRRERHARSDPPSMRPSAAGLLAASAARGVRDARGTSSLRGHQVRAADARRMLDSHSAREVGCGWIMDGRPGRTYHAWRRRQTATLGARSRARAPRTVARCTGGPGRARLHGRRILAHGLNSASGAAKLLAQVPVAGRRRRGRGRCTGGARGRPRPGRARAT